MKLRLNHFPLKLFEKAIKIKRQDKISDTEVLKKALMVTVVKLAQLRWTGYVIRLAGERLSNKVFCGELRERKRYEGDQTKRYKGILKVSLKDFDIPIQS